MQCHANSFARIEFECSLRDADNSLISNISCTKQLLVPQNLILILLGLSHLWWFFDPYSRKNGAAIWLS